MTAVRLVGPRHLGPLTEHLRSATRKLDQHLPPIAHFRSKSLLAEVSYLRQGEPTDLSVDGRKGRGFRPFEGSGESPGWYDL